MCGADVADAVFDEPEVGPVAQNKQQTAPVVDPRLAVDGDVIELA